MRVLAGSLKGRELKRPKTATVRPLGDKVRAALFNVVGSIEGFKVLDAYAGSGAVGLESISRGAEFVEAIEGNPAVARQIRANVSDLGVDFQYQLHHSTVESWLARSDQIWDFDLVVADPPYDQLRDDVLDRLGECLRSGGVLVISHSSKYRPPALESVQLATTKKYGDSSLSFYKR